MPTTVGLPGMTEMPWTSTGPKLSKVARVKSLLPALEPAPTTTTCAPSARAAATAARKASGLSGTGLVKEGSAPQAAAMARNTWEFDSMTCPASGLGQAVKSSTSSPVGMKVIRTRSHTLTSKMPAASSAPTS